MRSSKIIQMYQDNISTFGKYSTINWSTVQLYGVEHRREDTIMDTNLLMMQMDVLLTDTFLTIIHHLLQYYSCSNVGNSLMNVFKTILEQSKKILLFCKCLNISQWPSLNYHKLFKPLSKGKMSHTMYIPAVFTLGYYLYHFTSLSESF